MTQADVIIIGAGAAGLMAGRELIKAGKTVILLEARNRIGGRINQHTGAEFIHGNQPLTQALLNEAGIPYYAIPSPDFDIPHWSAFVQQLKTLEKDMSLQEFLDRYFRESQYADLKETVIRFACGYDTADPFDASILALRDEWLTPEGPQYRIAGGYDLMVNFLADNITKEGGDIRLSAVAQSIYWKQGRVEVRTEDKQRHIARQALITVPLGVMQASPSSEGSLQYSPALPEKENAAMKMGMGGVIKILLNFREAFWEKAGSPFPQPVTFIFSDKTIPTWWTQYPERSTLLTGWLGGTTEQMLKAPGKKQLMEMALSSLAAIFNMHTGTLQSLLTNASVTNWAEEPFTRGSYSYATVHTKTALPVLKAPVAGTLFFAGEGLYNGSLKGTVEAALASGKEVVKEMMWQDAH